MHHVAANNPWIGVRGVALEDLQRRRVPMDEPATKWPTSAPDRHQGPTLELLAEVRARLLGEPGWAWLSFGASSAGDANAMCGAAWNLFTALCCPIAQYSSGELACFVEVAEGGAGATHYSNSNRDGAFHTDGTLLETAPDVVGLFCLSHADQGGDTVLIDIQRLLRDAELHSYSALLGRAHTFSSIEPARGCIQSQTNPILTLDPPRIRYLRLYLEDDYRNRDQQLPRELREAMDVLDRLAADPEHQLAMPLRPGQVLLWDNRRFLHGRRAFAERERRRRLARFYGVWSSSGKCERIFVAGTPRASNP